MFRRRNRHFPPHLHQPFTPQPQPSYYNPAQPYINRPPATFFQQPLQQPHTPSLAELSQLDRLEREIIEMNKRLNNLSRRLRRIEDHLNVHD